MTVYQCSVCSKTHDTAKDPPCPQVFAIQKQQVRQPESPDASVPSWKRRYFCPQCPPPGVAQPRDGFHVVAFAEHVFSHARDALRDAVRDAERYEGRLSALEHLFGDDFTDWSNVNIHGVRHSARLSVHCALHPDDRDGLDRLIANIDPRAYQRPGEQTSGETAKKDEP